MQHEVDNLKPKYNSNAGKKDQYKSNNSIPLQIQSQNNTFFQNMDDKKQTKYNFSMSTQNMKHLLGQQ